MEKEKKQRKQMGVGFWIGFVFVVLLMLAVLELNQNTILGWALLIAVFAGFVWLYAAKIQQATRGMKWLSWLGLFAAFAVILLVTWPPEKCMPAVSMKHPEQTQVIQTQKGPVIGVYNEEHTVEVFAGIPYAKPPVGELRWRPPQDPDAWTEPLLCDTFAPMSMQVRNSTIYSSLAQIVGYHDYKISMSDNFREAASEDSLYLNVWKPAGEQKNLPVLVFIHGGSLQTGQPSYGDYNGEAFAADGVVTVNMGYRLGIFGFYADEELLAEDGTTGNYGLLDQIKALEWVRDNIEAFGGDPNNVTIAGESAGSACVDALCVSPLAKGLFHRAILESSTVSPVKPPHSYRSLADAFASGNELKERYGVSSVSELRALPAEKLVGEMNTQHHMTVDGSVLPEDPYQLRSQGVHNEEALLHGYNKEESGPFILFSHANLKNYEQKVRAYFKEYADEILALYPATTDEEADSYWAQIYGAVFFNYPHYCLNRLAVKEEIPAWEYYFSKDNGRLGSWHSGEMIYVFGNLPAKSRLFDEGDYALSDAMHQAWVNFVASGDPNGANGGAFSQNVDSTKLYEFGAHVGMIDEPYLKLYEIMDRMQGWE
ncbi:MAG: carboxylesterase family protein [Lachnospiraceae bacterium]|nr:carboxylesterase family protein [Lachnospiraceae bacterium]